VKNVEMAGHKSEEGTQPGVYKFVISNPVNRPKKHGIRGRE
jgi:hypothetical protein